MNSLGFLFLPAAAWDTVNIQMEILGEAWIAVTLLSWVTLLVRATTNPAKPAGSDLASSQAPCPPR